MWILAITLFLCDLLIVTGLQNIRSEPQILVEDETADIVCVNPSGSINGVKKDDYILPGCLRSSCSFYSLTSTPNKWTVHIKNVKKIRDAGTWTCYGIRLNTSFTVNVAPKGEFLLATEAAFRTIYKIDLKTESYTDMKFRQKDYPVAVSFDPTTSKVYWSENVLLKTADISGNQVEVVTGTGYGAVVDGVAVDYIHRLLYYTVEGLDTINILHLDNYDYTMTLIDTGLANPRGLALLSNEGMMFWTDWGSKPGIEVAKMDGSDRKTFLSFPNGSWPNGLTVDAKSRILFWVDAKDHTINAISLDKTNRKILFRSLTSHFYDIVLMGQYLYANDWTNRFLVRLRVNGDNAELFGIPVLMRSYGLYAYNSSEVIQGSSICKDAKCQHLCLPSGQRRYTCGCKNGYILASDKFSCKKKKTSWRIKLSSTNHSIIEGRELELVCELNTSVPNSLAYTWSKNGIPITRQQSKTFKKDNITRDDTGNYTCSNGNQEQTMQLRVLYPPEVQSPSTIDIIESSTLVINCNATANPTISSFMWTSPKEEPLTGKNNTAMTSSQLTIPSIDRSKAGNYTCTALNTMIESIAPKFPITTRSTSISTVNVLYVPVKDETYENQSISVSTNASLSCSIDSNPAPSSYNWYNPIGTLISKKSKLEQRIDQKGVYRCTVEIMMKPTVGALVTKTHTKLINVTIVDSNESSDNLTMIISLAVCASLLVIVATVVVAVICYRKRCVGFQRTNGTPLTNVGTSEISIVDREYSSLNRQSETYYDSIRVKCNSEDDNAAA